LYLHGGFESGVKMGCLEVFIGGIIMEALHRGRAVYAEEDHVAFGVEELERPEISAGVVGIGGKGRRHTDVSWSSSSSSSMLFQSSYGAIVDMNRDRRRRRRGR
jgi:hypothetical protein